MASSLEEGTEMNAMPEHRTKKLLEHPRQASAGSRTDNEQAEEELAFKSLLDSATDSVFVRGFDGKLIYVNEAAYTTRGYTKEELLAMPLSELRVPEHAIETQSRLDTLAEVKSAVYETAHRKKDGTSMYVEVHARVIEFSGRKVIASIVRDITERKKAEEALRRSEAKYRTLFEAMEQGVLYRDAQGRITEANPAAERILGVTIGEMLGTTTTITPWKVIHEDGSDFLGDEQPSMIALRTGQEVTNVVIGILSPGREWCCWANVHAIPQFRDGEDAPYQVFVTFEDITERKKAEEQLAHLAAHDPLTDLPNRRSLGEALKRATARARRGFPSALLFLDLDNFKLINDTLGHTAGDAVLINTAETLRQALRAEDILARLGGDEFAVLLDGGTIKIAHGAAERMQRAITGTPVVMGDHSFNLSLSIGLVVISGAHEPEVVLSKADAAMYEAKDQGGNQIVVCNQKSA